MSTLFYDRLSETFNEPDGLIGDSPFADQHVDIRAFHTDDILVPQVMSDLNFWNVVHFDGTTIGILDNPRSISGESTTLQTQANIDGSLQSHLDTETMFNLDLLVTVAGNENWPTGDPSVTVGKDPAYRYSNSIRIDLTGNDGFSTSNNTITDIERIAAFSWDTTQQGGSTDGAVVPGGIGGWEAGTNLHPHGQADSLDNWFAAGSGTVAVSLDSTFPAPWSPNSVKVIASGSAVEGIQMDTDGAQAAAPGLNGVGSVLFSGVPGQTYDAFLYWFNTDSTATSGSVSTFTARTGAWPVVIDPDGNHWEIVSPPGVVVAAGKTGDTLTLLLATHTARAETFHVANAMLQKGVAYVSPYVATSAGATATRPAARLQVPSSLINGTQFWFAFKLKPGWNAAQVASGAQIFFNWENTSDGNNRLTAQYSDNGSGGAWNFYQLIAGTITSIVGSPDVPVIGVPETVIIQATATQLMISVNGSSFSVGGGSTVTRDSVFSPSGDLIDLTAIENTIDWFDGSILWAACGTGTLTNLDAATLNSFFTITWDSLVADLSENISMTGIITNNGQLLPNAQKVVSSYFTDDLTIIPEPAGIELVLRNFPPQIAVTGELSTTRLDLANSYLDFSSDPSFDDDVTDSIDFSSGGSPMIFGGDLSFHIPLTELENTDISNIKAIRFRLASVGAMTFIAQAMRLVPQDWSPISTGIDTKRGTYGRVVPRNGGTDPVNPGYVFYWTTRPKDSTVYIRFNSGHAPATGSDDNEIAFVTRLVDSRNYTVFFFFSRSTQSQMVIAEVVDGLPSFSAWTPGGTNVLTPETDYILRLDTLGNVAQARLYAANGIFLGDLVYGTEAFTTTYTGRGQSGYAIEPYNYDFVVNSITTTEADFVNFQSIPFNSITPVDSAVLMTNTSAPANLLLGTSLIGAGDSQLHQGAIGGHPISNLVVRDGTQWYGGVIQDNPSYLGDPSIVAVSGDIFPVNTTQGDWRAVLVTPYGQVGWMGFIEGLIANQWNHFNIPINPELIPDNYYLLVSQTGFYSDTFYIDNLSLDHLTVTWEASVDSENWQPFGFSINDPYAGIKFLDKGTSLSVKATARSDKAWIRGYEVKPLYLDPGRIDANRVVGTNHFVSILVTQGQSTVFTTIHNVITHAISFLTGQSSVLTHS